MQKIFNLTNLTLIVALSLSTVAAYYSIIGLTAIFAGAAIPVIIMGSMLEIGKITTTVWLRRYWDKASWVLKLYLVPAVIALALLTSMGIFGFLSKAHMDTGLVSGDVQAKLALIDEKIKTQRDNVDIARKALQQMDAQVDARLSRGDSEQSAERAVQIRRQQAGERAKLQKDIGDAQKEIAKLNEERAPIAAENRKVEAEVGPIKYIAALIYGDNPDANLLEAAVRWVIILLVIVFDPLAIALVLAANASREWDRKIEEDKAAMSIVPPKDDDTRPFTKEEIDALDKPYEEFKSESEVDKFIEEAAIESIAEIEKEEIKNDPYDFSKHSYLYRPFIDKVPGVDRVGPLVYKPEPVEEVIPEQPEQSENVPVLQETLPETSVAEEKTEDKIIETENVTLEKPYRVLSDSEYVMLDGKHMRKEAAEALKPNLFAITADSTSNIATNFGTSFPKFANKGDMFVRVDVLPNRVFKFDGKRWIEVNKENSQTYLQNNEYIQFLISKIDSGEYEIEMLSEKEKEQIESFLNASK